ncbi:DUF6392 family protein, partial [Chimaeribacter arupi]
PTGFSGDPDLSLDMAKEGVYLSFRRAGRVLQDVTLIIQRPEMKKWLFPNRLPFCLEKEMTIAKVHHLFGEPLRSTPPKVVMKRAIGRADLYTIKELPIPVSMQIRYDIENRVELVSFFPTSELRW